MTRPALLALLLVGCSAEPLPAGDLAIDPVVISGHARAVRVSCRTAHEIPWVGRTGDGIAITCEPRPANDLREMGFGAR